jgi:hypothetical protein
MEDRMIARIRSAVRAMRRGIRRERTPARAVSQTAILRGPRLAALVAITILVSGASAVSFAESYRGLYLWAAHHGLSGTWAALWPVQVDVFIAVGELSLFVALADRWAPRSRTAAWLVTLAGLAVSVAGNVGHVTGRSLTVHATAAIPPLAAASALAVGLGVLKRVVEKHHSEDGTGPGVPVPSAVPSAAEIAAEASLRATLAAGNGWSVNQLVTQFRLTRAEATKLRTRVLAGSNGHAPGGGLSGNP